jgi:pSer/pThr/pTyr-binding forkhead associated (FHA) protein
MIANLIRLEPTKSPKRILLTTFPVVVGRSDEADVRLSDNWVSRSHCEIDVFDDSLAVRDLGSRNGTFVNGSRIEVTSFLPGDELRVGRSMFQVEYKRKRSGSASVLDACDGDILGAKSASKTGIDDKPKSRSALSVCIGWLSRVRQTTGQAKLS